jgi:predicted transcriptional regulator
MISRVIGLNLSFPRIRTCTVGITRTAQPGERAAMPKSNFPKREERLIVIHLILDMCRIAHKAHFPSLHFGHDLDMLFIFFAVFIGDAERRPMTAGKIAAYLDKPRATVTRKLGSLVKRGVLEKDAGRYRFANERVTGSLRPLEQMTRAVITAAKKLSKMDTSTLAKAA